VLAVLVVVVPPFTQQLVLLEQLTQAVVVVLEIPMVVLAVLVWLFFAYLHHSILARPQVHQR
jgi:hypothetical protein